MWAERITEDPDFGTGQYKARIDEMADEKVRDAFLDPNVDFNPYRPIQQATDMHHLINLLVFFTGRYFLLRGGKEISFLKWEQITFSEYDRGMDKGKRYVQLQIHSDKVNFLSLRNHTVKKGKLQFKLRESPDDPLCPYRLIKYYSTLCPPYQERFFCNYMTATQKKERKNPKASDHHPSWVTNPNRPIGENNMGEKTKELAHLCKFDDAQYCTNHGNRALGITTLVNAPSASSNNKAILTHSRHGPAKSQEPYIHDTDIAQHRLQNALATSLSKPQSEKLCIPPPPTTTIMPPSTATTIPPSKIPIHCVDTGVVTEAKPKVSFDDTPLLKQECIELKEELKVMSIAKYELEEEVSGLHDEIESLKRKFKDDLSIETSRTSKLRRKSDKKSAKMEALSIALKETKKELTTFKDEKVKEDHRNEQRQMFVDMLRVHDDQKKINCEIM